MGGSRDAPSSWLVFRLKALEKNFPAALALVTKLMTSADFGDVKRLKDLFNELTNDIAAAIVPSGSSFAAMRSAASFSEAQRIEELWRGISQFEFLSSVRAEADMDSFAHVLFSLQKAIIAREGLRINLTAGPEALDAALEVLKAAVSSLPASPTPISVPPPKTACGTPPSRFEAWTIPAQVGFSALCLPASTLGTSEFAHEQALGHLLSTSVLWDEIRVKGGAYGASAWTDGSEATFSFSSYRDPAPNHSLEAYREALSLLARDGLERDALERAVVGATGRDLRPMMPEEKGFVDFRRELYGVTDEIRKRKRSDLLGIQAKDLKNAAFRILDTWASRTEVLISHQDDIESMKRKNPTTSIHQLRL